VRQCHSNTCPVGVCTQDEKLRAKFTGTPEKVVNLFTFIAEEVREILASLGMTSLNEVIGRTDLLAQVSRGGAHLDDLDLNPLLVRVESGPGAFRGGPREPNPVPDTLDIEILKDAAPLFERGEKMQLTYTVKNTMRAVGTRLSSTIVRRYGMGGLPQDHLRVELRGATGQSFGAFAVQGLRLDLTGESNDYIGKGLSGATIVVRAPTSTARPQALIGNTALYGATSGRMFVAGTAGERFAVRNSGVETVVEGCGAHGCEYMTGGAAVILGDVGANFAAGMTGGVAFIYDERGGLERHVNVESVVIAAVEDDMVAARLKALVEQHVCETGSPRAADLLSDWDGCLTRFRMIVPKDLLSKAHFADPMHVAAGFNDEPVKRPGEVTAFLHQEAIAAPV